MRELSALLQVDALEQDASEILSAVRSLKNSMASINRIPPEVLSLIPDYSDEDYPDELPITLTHVCRSWRGNIHLPPLVVDQFGHDEHQQNPDLHPTVKVFSVGYYIRRQPRYETYLDDALFLAIPHIPRLRSFTFHSDTVPDTLRNFDCHTPLLEDLEIHISSPDAPTLDIPLLNGDLPSLRKSNLCADTIRLPQKNTSNLRVFNLFCT